MKRIIPVLSIIALLQSCSLFHFLSTSDKKEETPEEMNTFLIKYSIDTTNSFKINPAYLDSLSNPKFAINTYKLNKKVKASPVQIRMYNNRGQFLYGWEQCFGDLKRLGILDSFPIKKLAHLPVNMKLSFENDIRIIASNDEMKEHLISLNTKYDYTIIVYWAAWTGWYSADSLKSVRKHIIDHPGSSFLWIKINTSNAMN
jgi:hypothetical protein